MKDYYGILGVSPAASDLEIRKAFRRLAVLYHPDKNPAADARPVFHDINEAYGILSDPEKRARYDARRANPFAEMDDDPAVKHRDPAYRGTRPRQSAVKEPPATYMLMKAYLPRFMWVSRIGLVATLLFFLDYMLPYHHLEERIRSIQTVIRQKNISYFIVETDSGWKIKLYDFAPGYFAGDSTLRATVTPLYRTVMTVANRAGNYQERVAYLYRTLIFFPVLLFLTSLLAHIYRRNIEFSFTLNLAGLILLAINFVLI